MQLSIVIPVYNSHRVVRRQIKHFHSMGLPNDIEIILMDDGSDPPLKQYFPNWKEVNNLYIYPTCDKRPWTQACAKNLGARIADGEYIFITDIDHILPKETIMEAYRFRGDKMVFSRHFAVLDNKGRVRTDIKTLRRYGHKKPRRTTYQHTNTFCMKRKVFWDIGGYPEEDCDVGRQDNRDDTHLHNRYKAHVRKGLASPAVQGPLTYVFPAVADDPKGLFHNLDRYIGIQCLSVQNTLDRLCSELDKRDRVAFVRFGDSDVWAMDGGPDAVRHKMTPQLRAALTQAYQITDHGFLKAAPLGYPVENGMDRKTFLWSDNWVRRLRGITKKLTKDKVWLNPIVFHYLALYRPNTMNWFVSRYIRGKKILFVGGNERKAMESFYGPITHFVSTPRRDAFYSFSKWWPWVLSHIHNVDVVIPSVGAASKVLATNIWRTQAKVHFIDIGSTHDVIEGRSTRGWMERDGVDAIKKKLMGGK